MRASQYEPFITDKKEWISDKYFTQQRLAGVNPMSLRRVTFHGASEGQWFSLWTPFLLEKSCFNLIFYHASNKPISLNNEKLGKIIQFTVLFGKNCCLKGLG